MTYPTLPDAAMSVSFSALAALTVELAERLGGAEGDKEKMRATEAIARAARAIRVATGREITVHLGVCHCGHGEQMHEEIVGCAASWWEDTSGHLAWAGECDAHLGYCVCRKYADAGRVL